MALLARRRRPATLHVPGASGSPGVQGREAQTGLARLSREAQARKGAQPGWPDGVRNAEPGPVGAGPACGYPADVVAELFLATAEALAPLLRAPELAAQWNQPSALAEFRTSGLAGHTARAVLNVERYLDAEVPAGAARLDAVEYFLTANAPDVADPAAAMNQSIRERGEQEAASGPQALADAYDAARARLAAQLPGLPGDQPVLMFGRYVLPLNECLLTRLVELVVHADDLAVTLRLPTPDFGDEVADLVIATLARIARRRHGTVPVVRALARRERAPSTIAAF
jgi:Mycothiol maleylpyruvate isomerase N-terminal domain.